MSFKFFRINTEMPEKGNRVISYPERIFLQVTVHTSSKSFIDEYNSIIFILLATSIPFIDWAVFTEMIRIKYFSDFVSDWSMAFELWKYMFFSTKFHYSLFQVSGSKIWQMERSCMCCQESGEREASVSLFCPKAKPGERKFLKVNKTLFYLFKGYNSLGNYIKNFIVN